MRLMQTDHRKTAQNDDWAIFPEAVELSGLNPPPDVDLGNEYGLGLSSLISLEANV